MGQNVYVYTPKVSFTHMDLCVAPGSKPTYARTLWQTWQLKVIEISTLKKKQGTSMKHILKMLCHA